MGLGVSLALVSWLSLCVLFYFLPILVDLFGCFFLLRGVLSAGGLDPKKKPRPRPGRIPAFCH